MGRSVRSHRSPAVTGLAYPCHTAPIRSACADAVRLAGAVRRPV